MTKQEHKEHCKRYSLKFKCHRYLSEIWGDDTKGRKQAYQWLYRQTGKEIHFSEIDSLQVLQDLYNLLLVESFRAAQREAQNDHYES